MTPPNEEAFTLVDTAALETLLDKWRKEVATYSHSSDEYVAGLCDGMTECLDDLENLLAGKKP